MLTFNLKKQWYEKIRSGEKTIEYREVKPYWTKRIQKELSVWLKSIWLEDWARSLPRIECVLRLGYTKRYMLARITKIKVVDGKDTDLAIDAQVYAIHLADVREVGIC